MKTQRSLRIALIEDNQADAYLIEASLQDRVPSFELKRYETGDEALRELCPESGKATEPPDIILLDLHLPGTEGHEILRTMRDDARLADVPIVVISGASEPILNRTDLSRSSMFVQKSMNLDDYMRGVSEAVLKLSRQGGYQAT